MFFITKQSNSISYTHKKDGDRNKFGSNRSVTAATISAEEKTAELRQFSASDLSRCSTFEARSLLTLEQAQKLMALPLGLLRAYGKEMLTLAVPLDADRTVEQSLRFALGREVKLVRVERAIVSEAIFCAYNRDGVALEKSVNALKQAELAVREVLDEEPQKSLVDFRMASGEPAQFLMALVDYALSYKASDLHIIPKEDGCYVRLRINGEMYDHQAAVCSLETHRQIIARLKIVCSLDTTARKQPQDGSFSFSAHTQKTNIRVSLMPTIHGEKAVLRLGTGGGLMGIGDLGLDCRTLNALHQFARKSEGMVLFAGATGSGKTTTMYALMQQLSHANLSLVSIEDPVEVQLAGVAQTSIDEKAGLDYLTCLKSVVRQDPDAILLGEIRDASSAHAAFQAALTGHLLVSTVHARNVFEVFLRLQGFGLDLLTVSQALSLVVCQRLIPRLCPACKVFDLKGTNKCAHEVFKAVGCPQCDYSGYAGRNLVVESISLDQEVSKSLLAGRLDKPSLQAACNIENYSGIMQSMEKLLFEGKISFEEFENSI